MISVKVRKIFKSALSRQVSLVLAGNIAAAGLGFISFLLIVNGLSLSGFGFFNICISFLLILPALTPLGMNTSMITHVSAHLAKQELNKASEIASISFFLRVISSCLFSLTLICLTGYLAKNIFNYPDLTSLLILTACGVFFISLFNQVKSTLYAYKLFKQYIILLLLVDLIKLALIFYLRAAGLLSLFSSVMASSLTPLAGAIAGTWIIRDKVFLPVKNMLKKAARIFSFGKWVFVSVVAGLIFNYLPVFMITHLLNAEATGIYGLALNLAYIFPIIIASFNSVLLPEISGFQNASQFEKHLKIPLKKLSYAGGAVIFCLLSSGKLINLFFGSRYAKTIPIFNWIMLGYLVSLVDSTLLNPMLYSLKKPRIVALADVAKLIIMFAGCLLFIPAIGILAPAILTLGLNIGLTVFMFIYISAHLKKQKISAA